MNDVQIDVDFDSPDVIVKQGVGGGGGGGGDGHGGGKISHEIRNNSEKTDANNNSNNIFTINLDKSTNKPSSSEDFKEKRTKKSSKGKNSKQADDEFMFYSKRAKPT
jgi:hypothetical protein